MLFSSSPLVLVVYRYTGHFSEPVARTIFGQLLSALQVRQAGRQD